MYTPWNEAKSFRSRNRKRKLCEVCGSIALRTLEWCVETIEFNDTRATTSIWIWIEKMKENAMSTNIYLSIRHPNPLSQRHLYHIMNTVQCTIYNVHCRMLYTTKQTHFTTCCLLLYCIRYNFIVPMYAVALALFMSVANVC